MKGTFRIEKPDNLEASITLTMKMYEWGELKEQLRNKGPSGHLSEVITSLIDLARIKLQTDAIE